MDNDDRPIGQVLTRREALKLMGLASAAMLAACGPTSQATPAQPTAVPADPTTAATEAANAAATEPAAMPTCIVRPEQTEGPYFVDEQLNRSDIRSDPSNNAVKDGAPFTLKFRVTQINAQSCAPLAGAIVDIWHCDAEGKYSDAADPSFNTKGQKFLRGYQVTDANGVAQFTTIYPGWYSGRTVHIHFKLRSDLESKSYEFTSQLYFDDNFTDKVFTQAPYASKGERNMRNEDDGIYGDGGEELMLTVTEDGAGYTATFDVGLELG